MRYYYIILVFTAICCTPPLVFEQAYPSSGLDLDHIPFFLQGAYICESDSALVIINDQNITLHKEHFFDLKISYIEERDDCNIVEDKMYVSGRDECIPILQLNDSIVRGTVIEIDTLFVIQPGSVARSYKGHLVINQEIKPNQWAISLLTLESDGNLTYSAITDRSHLKHVKKVTPMKDITTKEDKKSRYKVRPTMKQFDILMNDKKVFVECEYLVRVHIDKI